MTDTTSTAHTTDSPAVSATSRRPRTWIAGTVLTVLIAAFLVVDVLGKLFQPDSVVEGTAKLGFTADQATVMGIVLALCTIVWLIPRTAVLGAVGITAYLGGAVTANWNDDAPLVSTTLFAVYLGVLLWVAMFLRRPALLSVFGLRSDR
ncbi:DoxX family protein [Williamsia deligens]|uniref:DoxX family protein n=1 Tax=Williamsia deligens TaxID=321325 RepID=A0ABW3G666_9NOCA|nr:DoxX family protein [Williamsia deligens]MCP2193555.1 DoxX-like family protein [Williamsia deligens]